MLLKTPTAVPLYKVEGVDGSMASAETLAVGMPPLAVAQLAPPSTVFRTPDPKVPANTVDGVCGSIASATTAAPSGPIGSSGLRRRLRTRVAAAEHKGRGTGRSDMKTVRHDVLCNG
jgi:hypothetical protein